MFVPCPRLISRIRLVILSRSWYVGRAASTTRRSASDSSSSVPRITEPKSTRRFRRNSAANRSRASRSALRSGAGNRRLRIILTPHGVPPSPLAYRNSKRTDQAWPTARQADAPRRLRVMQAREPSSSLRTRPLIPIQARQRVGTRGPREQSASRTPSAISSRGRQLDGRGRERFEPRSYPSNPGSDDSNPLLRSPNALPMPHRASTPSTW